MATLIERLQKRADEDLACAVNSEAVAEALSGEMAKFNEKTGDHNTYAVRVHLDHRNGARRDRNYAADLLEAVKLLSTQPSAASAGDELLHGMDSDAEYLRGLAVRVLCVPPMYGVDGFDADVLSDMAKRLS